MAKTKFKLGTLVKPNKKAPKFAQKRFANRYSFKITEMLQRLKHMWKYLNLMVHY